MKLYELRVAKLGIVRLRDTYYFTSQTDAMKSFRKYKKEQAVVDLYQCNARTNLKADDWLKLFESDAPGQTLTLTPVDLITDHVLVATYAPKEKAA